MKRVLVSGVPVAFAVAGLCVEQARGGADKGIVALVAVAALLAAIDALVRRRAPERLLAGHPIAAAIATILGIAAFMGLRPARLMAAIPLVWGAAAAILDLAGARDGELAPARRRLRRVFRTAVLLASLAAGALAGELFFRSRGMYATWTERNGGSYASPFECPLAAPWIHALPPNETRSLATPEFVHEVRANADGLRDVEHPVTKPPGEYRIVAVGDSFTMGQGADFEETWVRVLGRRLAASGRPGTFRVLNGGVRGSDPVFEYELLARRLLRYKPDLVLVMVNGSDVTDVILRGGPERFDETGAVHLRAPWFEPLYRRSHLVRAFVHNGFGYSMDLVPPDDAAPARARANRVLAETAERFVALGARERFATLILIQPGSEHLDEPPAEDFLAPLRGELAARRVPFLDLYPLLRAAVAPRDRALYYWPKDGHCTPRGYELMARAIESGLDERVQGFPR